MANKLHLARTTVSTPQVVLEPQTPFLYSADTEALLASNVAHELERAIHTDYRDSIALSRSPAPSAAVGMSSSQSASNLHAPSVCTSRSASPQRPPSRTTTPRSRNKTKRLDGEENFVKRPLNSFMLYRKDNQHNIPTNNHQSISRIIGDMWRKETAETKNFYDVLAKEERERHLRENPGYKFQPKKKKKEGKLLKPELKERHSSSNPAEGQRNMMMQPFDSTQPHQPKQTEVPSSKQMQESNVCNQPSQLPGSSQFSQGYQSADQDIYTEFPPQYAHYAGQVEYHPAQAYGNEGSHGAVLRDPQDWSLASEQQQQEQEQQRQQQQQQQHNYHLYQTHAPYQEMLPSDSTTGWPEPYSFLDYHMPPTFAEWENTRSGDAPIFQASLQADFLQMYNNETTLSGQTCDEQDFVPSHMKYGDTFSLAPGDLNGCWEVEPEYLPQFYNF